MKESTSVGASPTAGALVVEVAVGLGVLGSLVGPLVGAGVGVKVALRVGAPVPTVATDGVRVEGSIVPGSSVAASATGLSVVITGAAEAVLVVGLGVTGTVGAGSDVVATGAGVVATGAGDGGVSTLSLSSSSSPSSLLLSFSSSSCFR